MRMTILLHILGDTLGLIAGAVALSATKGAWLHRLSGRLFVYAMVAMAITGVMISVLRSIETNALGGLLAIYLVTTSLSTVRPFTVRWRWLDLVAMLWAFALGATSTTIGFELLLSGESSRHGVPIPILLLFGAVAFSAGISDVKLMRAGGMEGARRIARHLWRMCFAFFIATGSFFLGQADEIPEPLRITPVLVILALSPLVLMWYWLRRVRIQKTFQGIVGAKSH